MALSQLPNASGLEHKLVFEALGWVTRSGGNHIVMTHTSHPGILLSIPNHREVRKATLHSIVQKACLSDEQYSAFFKARPEGDAKTMVEDAEERFRHTPLQDGTTRVHCTQCGNEVCISANAEEMERRKAAHAAACSGPVL